MENKHFYRNDCYVWGRIVTCKEKLSKNGKAYLSVSVEIPHKDPTKIIYIPGLVWGDAATSVLALVKADTHVKIAVKCIGKLQQWKKNGKIKSGFTTFYVQTIDNLYFFDKGLYKSQIVIQGMVKSVKEKVIEMQVHDDVLTFFTVDTEKLHVEDFVRIDGGLLQHGQDGKRQIIAPYTSIITVIRRAA